jgi:hypothetical protein
MNCCDANGKCTGGAGCATRSPDCGQVLRLAPGVIEGHRVGLLGTPAQRRELKRWLLPSLGFSAVVALAGLAVGVIAGRFFP